MSDIVVRWGAGDLPSGTGTPAALDQLQWEGLYTRLENGAGSSGAVPPLVAVLAATAPLRPDGPLPIAIAHFSYGVPDDPATHETFFAAALLHDQWGHAEPTYRGRTVPFLVSDAFHLGGPPPDKSDRVGFGTTLLMQFVPASFQGEARRELGEGSLKYELVASRRGSDES